jgi:hypothetical protein
MNQAEHPAGALPGEDAVRWRDAARLRAEHSGWVIVWLARTGQFRAYKRLGGARRDTSLTAATAEALATRITAAEQAVARPALRARGTR